MNKIKLAVTFIAGIGCALILAAVLWGAVNPQLIVKPVKTSAICVDAGVEVPCP